MRAAPRAHSACCSSLCCRRLCCCCIFAAALSRHFRCCCRVCRCCRRCCSRSRLCLRARRLPPQPALPLSSRPGFASSLRRRRVCAVILARGRSTGWLLVFGDVVPAVEELPHRLYARLLFVCGLRHDVAVVRRQAVNCAHSCVVLARTLRSPPAATAAPVRFCARRSLSQFALSQYCTANGNVTAKDCTTQNLPTGPYNGPVIPGRLPLVSPSTSAAADLARCAAAIGALAPYANACTDCLNAGKCLSTATFTGAGFYYDVRAAAAAAAAAVATAALPAPFFPFSSNRRCPPLLPRRPPILPSASPHPARRPRTTRPSLASPRRSRSRCARTCRRC